MTQRTVGLIGLGLAGNAIARRLIAQGVSVTGYDLAASASAAAAQIGVFLAADAATLARAQPVLLLSLPDSDVVKRLLWDDGLADALRPGALILDLTTGRPQDAADNAGRLAERHVRFVDVTLSGSSEDIAAGRATALVGDREEAADYAPLVSALVARAFYLGAPGAGCRCKLVINHIMGLNRAALAEGLAFGMAAGMDGEQLLAVIRDSAAYSRVADMKGERMVRGDYAPASKISQHTKDVRLILEAAQQAGLHLPLEEVHASLLAQAIELGLGEMDNAAIIEVCRAGP
ncbi:MAG: NAD(P)-dependent oxidoreductase [Armatimonadetes bacterium]|nr:NAD(P)-dependent oxidoreductase [Armatimonadota bacterium]